tara:strand:- start:10303 stop:11316 length:1014 start_codon:yes stop_codon:yes gene_type:complete
MIILGIETSCDETGVALYDSKKNKILSENIFSQAAKHALYGGVVPELASRDQVLKLLPMVKLTLSESGKSSDQIDAIAYTKGPGLSGSLLVGASFANSLSLGWSKPCVGVHHMEAHLLVNLLEERSPQFPFLTLLVSGGHTLLIKALEIGQYQVLGQTRDDAVGEAFDKVAKILGMNYPGGPEIEKIAKKGNPNSYNLPRPMLNKKNLDFSFSGLKTAVLYVVKKKKLPLSKDFKADIAASFQAAVAETLVERCKSALLQTGDTQLVIGGGVASNQYVRKRLQKGLQGIDIFFPNLSRCTDNGAMVAVAGYHRFNNESSFSKSIEIKPRWDLSELNK